MFKIKSIHAAPFADKEGRLAIRLTLCIWPLPIAKEKIVFSSSFSDRAAVDKAVEVVNEQISPALKDSNVFWNLDLNSINGKIRALDNAYFTEDESGSSLYKGVTSLIKDTFNMDFLLTSSATLGY